MADPVALASVALADRLKMLPSEFMHRATKWDMVQILALDRTRDEEWLTEHKRQEQLKKSADMTSSQRISALKQGLKGG